MRKKWISVLLAAALLSTSVMSLGTWAADGNVEYQLPDGYKEVGVIDDFDSYSSISEIATETDDGSHESKPYGGIKLERSAGELIDADQTGSKAVRITPRGNINYGANRIYLNTQYRPLKGDGIAIRILAPITHTFYFTIYSDDNPDQVWKPAVGETITVPRLTTGNPNQDYQWLLISYDDLRAPEGVSGSIQNWSAGLTGNTLIISLGEGATSNNYALDYIGFFEDEDKDHTSSDDSSSTPSEPDEWDYTLPKYTADAGVIDTFDDYTDVSEVAKAADGTHESAAYGGFKLEQSTAVLEDADHTGGKALTITPDSNVQWGANRLYLNTKYRPLQGDGIILRIKALYAHTFYFAIYSDEDTSLMWQPVGQVLRIASTGNNYQWVKIPYESLQAPKALLGSDGQATISIQEWSETLKSNTLIVKFGEDPSNANHSFSIDYIGFYSEIELSEPVYTLPEGTKDAGVIDTFDSYQHIGEIARTADGTHEAREYGGIKLEQSAAELITADQETSKAVKITPLGSIAYGANRIYLNRTYRPLKGDGIILRMKTLYDHTFYFSIYSDDNTSQLWQPEGGTITVSRSDEYQWVKIPYSSLVTPAGVTRSIQDWSLYLTGTTLIVKLGESPEEAGHDYELDYIGFYADGDEDDTSSGDTSSDNTSSDDSSSGSEGVNYELPQYTESAGIIDTFDDYTKVSEVAKAADGTHESAAYGGFKLEQSTAVLEDADQTGSKALTITPNSNVQWGANRLYLNTKYRPLQGDGIILRVKTLYTHLFYFGIYSDEDTSLMWQPVGQVLRIASTGNNYQWVKIPYESLQAPKALLGSDGQATISIQEWSETLKSNTLIVKFGEDPSNANHSFSIDYIGFYSEVEPPEPVYTLPEGTSDAGVIDTFDSYTGIGEIAKTEDGTHEAREYGGIKLERSAAELVDADQENSKAVKITPRGDIAWGANRIYLNTKYRPLKGDGIILRMKTLYDHTFYFSIYSDDNTSQLWQPEGGTITVSRSDEYQWVKIPYSSLVTPAGVTRSIQDWSLYLTGTTLIVKLGESPEEAGHDYELDYIGFYSETNSPAPDVIRGDIDGDGKVTAQDALAILRMVVGLGKKTDAADLDGDGAVTAQDALIVLRIVVGLE